MKKLFLLGALVCISQLYCMEQQETRIFDYIRSLPMELQDKILEDANIYFRLLPKELQEKILSSFDAIEFLSQQPTTFEGYNPQVNSVGISGNLVVTGSRDGIAKIWNIDGQLLHILKGHTDAIHSVAISGKLVVTGSGDGTAKIWNIDGQLLHTLKGHGEHMDPFFRKYGKSVKSVAISGNFVVTGSLDGTAKIWNIDGRLLHTFEDEGQVGSVAISGNLMVTGSFDGTVKIWNIDNGQLLHILVENNLMGNNTYEVAISGDKIMTGSGGQTVAMIWNIDGQLLHMLEGFTGGISSIAINENLVVIGSWDGTAKIFNLNGQLLRTLAGHTGIVSSVAINDDKVVTGSYDKTGTVKIWSLKPLAGTPQDNPLLWIIYNATLLQLDFINRAYQATIAKRDLIIAMPPQLGKIQDTDTQEQRDGNIYFSFPEQVRKYLREHLNIRK